MNRAMFSGVAGLKTHQTKMDVIGNNIANVNTYGFKSQRAVFSDIYYQTLTGASAGTANRGGVNPSSVGYGSTLSGIQTQMSQSSMQNTGFGMDVAIMGDGFLQVMDPAGNIFYTKAGLLDYDANGYLTDINGNFVLGAPGADGNPGSQKIRLDNIGSVNPKTPSATIPINGVDYTLSASNATKYGNVSISIGASEALPAGLKASATISPNGSIAVLLNSYEKFGSISEVSAAINEAVKEANNGKEHAAGTFTLTASKDKFGTDPTNGTWTGGGKADPTKISSTDANGFFGGALSLKGMNLASFPGAVENSNMTMTTKIVGGVTTYDLSMIVNGVTYTGSFPANVAEGASIEMKSTADATKSITMGVSDLAKLQNVLGTIPADASTATSGTTTTPPTYFFGGTSISAVSDGFIGTGPMGVTYTAAGAGATATYNITVTVGGKVYTGTVNQAAGGKVELKTADPKDGTITMDVPTKADMLKNFGVTSDADLKTALDNSLTQHNLVGIPATPGASTPLTGAEIAGVNFGTKDGTIAGMEDGAFGGNMVFQKTSKTFKGNGTVTDTQFKSVYHDNGVDAPFWTVSMGIGGKNYTADISKDTLSSSLLLKGPDGDSIQLSNPGFDAMTGYYKKLNPGLEPTEGAETPALTGGKTLTVTPATTSKDLGLSSTPFTLAGGTEGGAITLDQLSSISVGLDGTVSVSHAEKGTVVAGKISLANFANPSGLLLEGKNYFSATANSGAAKLCDPGSGGTGGLKSSALEMSNVDLSSEMADMITTQRGFQANSRIITVSDSMLEELINLKR